LCRFALCWVYEIKWELRGARSPKVLESTGEDATTQGNDGIGSGHGPAHSGLFKALPDDRAAAGLDHTRAPKGFFFMILGIAPLRGIFLEVAQLFEPRLFALGGSGQVFTGLANEPAAVARFEPIPPGLGSLGLRAPEDLCDGCQMRIGVEPVHDRHASGEMGLDKGVVITRSVGQHDHRLGLFQTPAQSLGVQAAAEEFAGFNGPLGG